MRRILASAWRDRTARTGLIVVGVIVMAAVVGPLLVPFAPAETSQERLVGPGAAHWLGTDQFGRDVFSRLIVGARVSLTVAVGGCLLALLVGGLVGAVAGYRRGAIDEVSMRIVDVLMAFPFLVLAIVLAFVAGPSVLMLILVVAITRIPQFARLMRGGVLDVMAKDYVTTARAIWGDRQPVLWRHVVPNAITPVIAYASVAIGVGVNIEAALSFLGVGVQPPTPSWGSMMSEGKSYMLDAPWLTMAPGVAILVTVVAFNVLADGLRDVLDPTRVSVKSSARRRRSSSSRPTDAARADAAEGRP